MAGWVCVHKEGHFLQRTQNTRPAMKENASTKGARLGDLVGEHGLKEHGGLPVLVLVPGSSWVPKFGMVARQFFFGMVASQFSGHWCFHRELKNTEFPCAWRTKQAHDVCDAIF